VALGHEPMTASIVFDSVVGLARLAYINSIGRTQTRGSGSVQNTREGFLYGLAAYGWWGLVPIYFRWLGNEISPFDVLAHRIAWSALLLAVILSVTRRWRETLHCLRTPHLLFPLTVSALLVGYNWLMYVLSIHLRIIVQASLGYYILPLLSIALARLLFGERMRHLQQVAIVLACAGVSLLAWELGELPWLALGIAISFGAYGTIRKTVPVDGLVGLAVETIVLLPTAVGYLAIVSWQRQQIEEPDVLFKLSMSGIVTAVPMICFGQAARRLPLTMLGFMQYISPSVQLLLAVFLFGEAMRGGWWSYILVWSALVIFSVDSYQWYRHQKLAAALST
jgi:chloramphenicol-sensitive protein RarD